jgi:hypothetical protein
MSNALAIAAATATLRSLLIHGLGIPNVTVKPPDTARNDVSGDQVNLFLYQTAINAAWRNQDMPRQVRPGETGQPPLPLCLYYLVTAYGEGDDETKGHQLLGRAMSVLHDHPLLDADEIKQATQTDVAGSDLHDQIERVRITPQSLSLEELSKLWAAFQTHYRLSAAYQVSVVLIESTRPTRAPLPVLTRGKDDRGVRTLLGGLPILDEVRVPLSGAFTVSDTPTADEVQLVKALPSAQLGDEVALIGQNFSGETVRVIFERQWTGESFEPDIVKKSDEVIIVKLPQPGNANDPQSATTTRPAGFYLATVIVQRTDEPDRRSNSIVFALAPTITLAPTQATPGNIALTVTSAPMIQPGQRASLLFRNGEIVTAGVNQASEQLTFNLPNVPAGQAGEYVVRLRVDGVDSIPIDRQSVTPKFASNQILKVA